MKKWFSFILILIVVTSLFACSQENAPAQSIASELNDSSINSVSDTSTKSESQLDEISDNESISDNSQSEESTIDESQGEESISEQPTYPYVDTEGRTRYQLYINNKLIETQHDPYTYASEPNGAYYPIVEIFNELGVECLFDESIGTLTTKINGVVIKCSNGNEDIIVGNKTLGCTASEYIDDCFYVPSFTFIELLDAVVDFNNDRSGVTITTDLAINTATSGIQGLSISADTVNTIGEKIHTGNDACPSCGGTGKGLCTRCSGTGYVTTYIQKWDPITNRMTITSTRTICSSCGGTGRTTCPACGGSGQQ